jgi:hypothetical protein
VGKTARGEEEKIKKKIVEYHERGVCGRYGEHIPKHKRGNAGKGDRRRDKKVYNDFRIKVWPRDENGNLIGDD